MLLQFFSQLASLQKNYYKKHAVTTPDRAFQGSAIRSLLWNCQQFELPAIPQQRFAPFQSLPQKKCPTATVIVFSQLNKFSTLTPFTKTYFPPFWFLSLSSRKKKSLAATYFPTARAVSSALESLTSVFGMGTGIASPLWPPDIYYNILSVTRYSVSLPLQLITLFQKNTSELSNQNQ